MNYDSPTHGDEDVEPPLPAYMQKEASPMANAVVAATEHPYFSKSRVKQAKTCKRSFYYTYVLGLRTDGNFYTKRGTRIHKAFENYYQRLTDAVESGEFFEHDRYDGDTFMEYFGHEDVGLWLDWVRPFITNFIRYEVRRWEACYDSVLRDHGDVYDEAEYQSAVRLAAERFVPYAVELEGYLDRGDEPHWMGYADGVYHAASIPEVDATEGYVIVDFKTGKTPKEQYRNEGIFLEGEFYAALFEDELDIAAVAGYYPMNDDFIIAPLSDSRRELIGEIVDSILDAEEVSDFPLTMQPLCKWGPDDEDQCDHYDYCPSNWGEAGGPGPTYE